MSVTECCADSPRRHGRRVTASFVTASFVTASVALLVAACTRGGNAPVVARVSSSRAGSSSVSAGRSSTARLAVGYSRCMRSHGVRNFPDPYSDGTVPKADPGQLGVSSAQLQRAQTACADLLPTGGSLQDQINCLGAGSCPPVVVARILTSERGYARCMRTHGVPNWPDPTMNDQGMPVFDTTAAGIDRQFLHSSQFRSPNAVCQRVAGGAPVPRQ